MRVLMTTDTVGGVWSFSKELVAGLLEKGWAVALASVGPAPTASQQAWTRRMEERWEGAFHFQSAEVPLEWMQGNENAYSAAAPWLMEMVEEFGPDVVHSNQFCFGALPAAVPKIVTAHSDVLSWARSCRLTPLEETEWLRRYRRIVQDGLRGADAVAAPTQWMMDALSESFELPPERAVIPNGCRVKRPASAGRKLQAVTAGRLWDDAKGISMLRDVSSPMPLLAAGECCCEGAVLSADLGELRLLGSLPQEDLLTLFAESAVYVCTSRYEPFGLAAVEAAQCGCAVVANSISSLREVWEDGALYFDGADSLSSILKDLYATAEMLEAARARSFERAQQYSRESMTDGYLSLFDGVLRAKGTRGKELDNVA